MEILKGSGRRGSLLLPHLAHLRLLFVLGLKASIQALLITIDATSLCLAMTTSHWCPATSSDKTHCLRSRPFLILHTVANTVF